MSEWKIFSPEGKIYKTLDFIADLVIWNLLWILCSIPLVTVGVSTCALCQMTTNRLQKKGTRLNDWVVSMKDNCLFGIAFQIAIIGILLFCYWGLRISNKSVFSIVFILLGIVGLAIGAYVLPSRAVFLGSWKSILKLSVYLALKMPLFFMVKLILVGLYILAFEILQQYYISGLLPVLLLFGASAGNMLCQRIYLGIIRRLGFVKSEEALIED